MTRSATDRRLVRYLAAAGAVLASLLWSPATTSAGGGYPFDGARDCSSIFGSSSWCIDKNSNGRYEYDEQWSPAGFAYRNCTDYVANRVRAAGFGNFSNSYGGGRFGNAKNWDDNARALGWTVSTTPRVRSIAVSNSGTWGHVAWVESVNADGSVNVSEYNRGLTGTYGTRSGLRFDAYIYVPKVTSQPPSTTAVSKYGNSIVKLQGDTQTAWYVSPDLKRMWIPDGGTYNQLKARGVPGPYTLSGATINQLPDQRHQWVASGATWTGNRALRRGMSVKSADGRYRFAMQSDGNLVLYGPSGRALWATSWQVSSWRTQEFVIFQADGNLVTYGGGRAIWSSRTAGSGSRFVVQSDGNLVIYNSAGRAVWASGTNGRT